MNNYIMLIRALGWKMFTIKIIEQIKLYFRYRTKDEMDQEKLNKRIENFVIGIHVYGRPNHYLPPLSSNLKDDVVHTVISNTNLKIQRTFLNNIAQLLMRKSGEGISNRNTNQLEGVYDRLEMQ